MTISATLADADARLLTPLADDSPCGPDLEYDPDFVVLQANVASRGDAQYGDFIEAAPSINWAEAERDCRALLARSRDLRLMVILARCRTRQAGAAGLQSSLTLIDAMLRTFSAQLNPVPIFDGESDPLIVSNAIGALADPEGLAGDIRDIDLPRSMGTPLKIRDIERALAKTRVRDALAPEVAQRLIADLHDRRDACMRALAGAGQALARLRAYCHEHLGESAPDLEMLTRLLAPFQGTGSQIEATAAAAATTASATPTATPSAEATPVSEQTSAVSQAQPFEHAPASATTPLNRWDMLAQLQTIRAWFETQEPSSPVGVLLRQAERMVGKRYAELQRMLPAELLAQWDDTDD